MTSYLDYLHCHLQHYYINLQLTQIYKQHYANHNDVKFLYIWSVVTIVVISHTAHPVNTAVSINAGAGQSLPADPRLIQAGVNECLVCDCVHTVSSWTLDSQSSSAG